MPAVQKTALVKKPIITEIPVEVEEEILPTVAEKVELLPVDFQFESVQIAEDDDETPQQKMARMLMKKRKLEKQAKPQPMSMEEMRYWANKI